jgi:hypothetical protein
MQKRTHDNKMTINYNKEDLRQKKIIICHKLVSDQGALCIMCERNEEP